MGDKVKGYLFVLMQFVLLGFLITMPSTREAGVFPETLFALGAAIMLAGLVLLVIALISLGRSISVNPVPKANAPLVTTGLYAKMRHPIYSGLLLATLGAAIWGGLIPHLLIWFALVSVLSVKAAYEEMFLLAKHPEYESYKAKTGRFIPRLRKAPRA
ncbi:MAG: hypothetical protein RIQ31_22 [Actinomycetota bacterium]|jgi:protein-S-isoprenylcysteine O-methyltransferase Ste14